MRNDVPVVRATKIAGGLRRPSSVSGRRSCADDDCETILNRYNKSEFCYQHRPRRFGRVRGSVIKTAGQPS